MESDKRKIKVFMFPWLAHGHISPFLELAKALCKRNFMIYLCSSRVNFSCIKKKLNGNYEGSIKLVELHVPTLPDLPPKYHTTKNLPPHLMPTLKKVLDMSRPMFCQILETVKPDILIYDFIQPWAPVIASKYNIPAVIFVTSSAAMTVVTLHHYTTPSMEFPFPNVYLHNCDEDGKLTSENNDEDKNRFIDCIKNSCGVMLVKSCREVEGKYIDYLSMLAKKRSVIVGPLVQCPDNDHNDDVDIMHWLEKKELKSTVFVSFGSEYFLSKEEINEIAYGLELSGVNFIWVVRFPLEEKKIRVDEVLPIGFLEKIQGKGMVIQGWAPQVKILKHPNIGGFVSHCGWSSVMEGIHYNVPIIAVPMHIDQPVNARVLEEVGVGVEVKRREKNGMIEREEIAKVIKKVVKGKIGRDLKKKQEELSEKISVKEEDLLDEVAKELVKLCSKTNGKCNGGLMN